MIYTPECVSTFSVISDVCGFQISMCLNSIYWDFCSLSWSVHNFIVTLCCWTKKNILNNWSFFREVPKMKTFLTFPFVLVTLLAVSHGYVEVRVCIMDLNTIPYVSWIWTSFTWLQWFGWRLEQMFYFCYCPCCLKICTLLQKWSEVTRK